jgi:hypothetical protein
LVENLDNEGGEVGNEVKEENGPESLAIIEEGDENERELEFLSDELKLQVKRKIILILLFISILIPSVGICSIYLPSAGS